MVRKDELTFAIRSVWAETMTEWGFTRIGRRNFARYDNDILAAIDFQVSAYGSKDFCVNISVGSAASRSGGIIFRLRHSKGADLWLKSATAEQAERSATEALSATLEQLPPVLEANSSPLRHAGELRRQNWGSKHHWHFAIGVAELLAGREKIALEELGEALRLYRLDSQRVGWAEKYATEVEALLTATEVRCHNTLLASWATERLVAVRLKARAPEGRG